ncbi:MAG: hypothetical protein KY468_08440 [Armatimonadetes bacterium]|nr:hypothetical protein [Armatimonadota bacterium]
MDTTNTTERLKREGSMSLEERQKALESALADMEHDGKPEPLLKAAREKVEAARQQVQAVGPKRASQRPRPSGGA